MAGASCRWPWQRKTAGFTDRACFALRFPRSCSEPPKFVRQQKFLRADCRVPFISVNNDEQGVGNDRALAILYSWDSQPTLILFYKKKKKHLLSDRMAERALFRLNSWRCVFFSKSVCRLVFHLSVLANGNSCCEKGVLSFPLPRTGLRGGTWNEGNFLITDPKVMELWDLLFWRPEVQGEGIGRHGPSRGFSSWCAEDLLSVPSRGLPSVCLYPGVSPSSSQPTHTAVLGDSGRIIPSSPSLPQEPEPLGTKVVLKWWDVHLPNNTDK